MTTRPTPPHSGADIVGKIREALKAADHICRVDNWPLNRLKVQETLALLPQLESLLAKEPVHLAICREAVKQVRQSAVIHLTDDGDGLYSRAVLEAAGVPYAE